MFKINAIRSIQEKESVKNIKILAFSDSNKELINEVLQENGIVIMSVVPSSKPLGNLYEFGIKGKENQISIILPTEGKIRDAFKEFIDKFAIVDNLMYVKPYNKNFSQEKLKQILTQLKKEFGLIKEKKRTETGLTTSKADEKDISSFKESLLEEVTHFIEDVEKFLPFAKENFPVESKNLEDILSILKKYRVSTNIYKLANAFSQALEIGQDLEIKYIHFLEENDKMGAMISIISEFEIIEEYKTYEKVKSKILLQKVNRKEFKYHWYETLFYQIFGSYGVHIKLIFKEVFKKFKIKGFHLSDFLLFFQFLFLFIGFNYIILLVLVKLGAIQFSSILGVYYGLILTGYLGIVCTLSKLISYENKFIAIIILVIGLLLWGVIKSYFAL